MERPHALADTPAAAESRPSHVEASTAQTSTREIISAAASLCLRPRQVIFAEAEDTEEERRFDGSGIKAEGEA